MTSAIKRKKGPGKVRTPRMIWVIKQNPGVAAIAVSLKPTAGAFSVGAKELKVCGLSSVLDDK